MLAELRLRCRLSSPELYTTQNMYRGQDLLVLRGRYIFGVRLFWRDLMPLVG
jgi:hypothetical protein